MPVLPGFFARIDKIYKFSVFSGPLAKARAREVVDLNGWSLAITPPRRELHVSERLTSLYLDYRLYSVKRKVVHRGQVIDRLFPAFPGYIFVAAQNRWKTICDVSGITRFVKFDEQIGYVPDQVIHGLDQASDHERVLKIPEAQNVCLFNRGDRVRVVGESLAAGYIGIFDSVLDDGKAIVMMDWMGRWIPTNVDQRDLSVEIKKRKHRSRKRKRR